MPVSPSACPFVRPSVTILYCVKMGKYIDTILSQPDSPIIQIFSQLNIIVIIIKILTGFYTQPLTGTLKAEYKKVWRFTAYPPVKYLSNTRRPRRLLVI